MNYHLGHIPVSLINEVIRRKWITYFRTFIVLKYEYTNVAFFKNKEQPYNDTKDVLNISDKTFRRHLKMLVNFGFLGVDKNESYYIRSYNHLRTAYGLKKTRKVEVTLKDINKANFKSYLYGSAVGFLALKKQNRKKWEVLKKDGINQSHKFLKYQEVKYDFSIPLSARYLVYYLNTSKTFINKELRIAKEKGYIFFEKDIRQTGLTDKNISHILRLRQGDGVYPFSSGGFVYLSYPNKFKPTLGYKREKK